MSRNLALQANWIHPPDVEAWLRKMSIGKTLNVCCGMSEVGEARVDILPETNRTIAGDLFKIRDLFRPLSFDTVICDPPFSYYNRFDWLKALRDITRHRLLLSSDSVNAGFLFSKHNWKKNIWILDRATPFIRLYWCFDRLNGFLDSE